MSRRAYCQISLTVANNVLVSQLAQLALQLGVQTVNLWNWGFVGVHTTSTGASDHDGSGKSISMLTSA